MGGKRLTPEQRIERKAARLKSRRIPSLALIRNGKDRPCADCGMKYHWFAMDYDHIPERGVKLFNVSQGNCRNIDLIAAEIAKCDVVCSNCHRVRTYRRMELDKLSL